MNLMLCGPPMCGKTTAGERLSKKLNHAFIDTDRLIERAYGRGLTCREIYKTEGTAVFRRLESQQIASLQDVKQSVIALGGGCLADPDNVEILRSIGWLIYLKMDSAQLWERVHRRGVPAYLDPADPRADFDHLIQQRALVYEAAAHLSIDINHLSEEAVVNTVLKKYGK